MVTTNSIKKKIDNVLADTSVFAMMVLEKPLQELHTEIDLVTTPRGRTSGDGACIGCLLLN